MRPGSALGPARRLCLLDLRQGQWPLEPFILVGAGKRANRDLASAASALSLHQPMDRFQRALPFDGRSRRAEPSWSGPGEAPTHAP
jgi:hypothetical protein